MGISAEYELAAIEYDEQQAMEMAQELEQAGDQVLVREVQGEYWIFSKKVVDND